MILSVTPIKAGPWSQLCYLVSKGDNAILVDPGANAKEILAEIDRNNLNLQAICNTHGHFDHIGAVTEICGQTGAPFFISSREVPIMKSANMFRLIFRTSDKVDVPQSFLDLETIEGPLNFGPITINLLSTPGHTPGGYCFEIEGNLFTGDTLLPNSSALASLPGGNIDELRRSLDLLRSCNPDWTVHPGHGKAMKLSEALETVSSA